MDAGTVESVPTEYDYFQSTVLQAAVINEYDQDITADPIQHGAPIEFLILPTGFSYLDLNSSKLEVQCKITKADGTNVAADANVGVTNLTLHSLFRNIEMEIGKNRKTITDTTPLYPYRAFFETLLSYSKHVKKTRLLTEGWIEDTVKTFDDFQIDDAGHNAGFKARAANFSTSKTVTLIGRPHLDLFHQDKDIPSGVDVVIRLIPAMNAFVIKKHDGAENYRIVILSAKMWIRRKELSQSLSLAHEKMLADGHNFRIPFTKVLLKQLTIPTGVTSISFDNFYTGTLPERLLLAFVTATRLNGSYTANPFRFEHFDLREISILANGHQMPARSYRPNFATGSYLREYLGTLESLNLESGNKTNYISPTQWADTYPIFIFRFNPSGLPTFPQTGPARLDLQFATATPEVINIICLSENHAVLELDRFRNAILL